MTTAPILVVMGVAGAGKTTVGELIAKGLGWPFVDGDDLHPQANIDKMRGGAPLPAPATAAPWLAAIGAWIDARAAAGEARRRRLLGVEARLSHDILRAGRPQVRIFYLRGAQGQIAVRLARRRGRFWPAKLLASQFAALQEPAARRARHRGRHRRVARGRGQSGHRPAIPRADAQPSIPEIEPYDTGMLDVGDDQRIYWEACSDPDGKPALMLHGGPGSGCTVGMRRCFDPACYRAICFSTSAGPGRSTAACRRSRRRPLDQHDAASARRHRDAPRPPRRRAMGGVQEISWGVNPGLWPTSGTSS